MMPGTRIPRGCSARHRALEMREVGHLGSMAGAAQSRAVLSRRHEGKKSNKSSTTEVTARRDTEGHWFCFLDLCPPSVSVSSVVALFVGVLRYVPRDTPSRRQR